MMAWCKLMGCLVLLSVVSACAATPKQCPGFPGESSNRPLTPVVNKVHY